MQKHSILDVWSGSEYASAENKAGVRRAKRTLNVATWNLNLRDMCFEIFQWYQETFECAR